MMYGSAVKALLLKPTRTQGTSGAVALTFASAGYYYVQADKRTGKEYANDHGAARHRDTAAYRGIEHPDIQPGWRLLIPSRSRGVLAADLTDVATSATVEAAFGPPAEYYVRISDEVVRATAGFGTTTLTIARGQFGTTATAHVDGDMVVACKVYDIAGLSPVPGLYQIVNFDLVEVAP